MAQIRAEVGLRGVILILLVVWLEVASMTHRTFIVLSIFTILITGPISSQPLNATSIANGDFENGNDGSWTEFSTHGYPLIVQGGNLPLPISPHGGSWTVWLGGDYDEISTLSQTITIPSNATFINYWIWTVSSDICGYDFFTLTINGVTIEELDLCVSQNTGEWVFRQINIAAWRGQTVVVTFITETDDSFLSSVFLDDVYILPPDENGKTITPSIFLLLLSE